MSARADRKWWPAASRMSIDQRQHQTSIDYARRAADQDVEWRYPMASNRFDDRAQQTAYEARYRALTRSNQ